MSTTYFIAGSVFIVLSISWFFIKKKSERNKEYEKAKTELDVAIDSRNWDSIDDARNKLRKLK